MLKNIISIIFMASLIFGCSDLNNIESPRKTIKKVGESVLAKGRWKALPGTTTKVVSKINFTSITCDLKKKRCEENISLLYAPGEAWGYEKSMLYSDKYIYEITDWTNNIIKAKYEAPAADIEIRISVKDNFAELSYRETKARGDETSNPNIYGKWVLE